MFKDFFPPNGYGLGLRVSTLAVALAWQGLTTTGPKMKHHAMHQPGMSSPKNQTPNHLEPNILTRSTSPLHQRCAHWHIPAEGYNALPRRPPCTTETTPHKDFGFGVYGFCTTYLPGFQHPSRRLSRLRNIKPSKPYPWAPK